MATELPSYGILDGEGLDPDSRLMSVGGHHDGGMVIEVSVSTRPYSASRVTG